MTHSFDNRKNLYGDVRDSSAGELYPYVIRQIGLDEAARFDAIGNGQLSPRFKTAKEAEEWVKNQLKN